jgi:hypothetical protein
MKLCFGSFLAVLVFFGAACAPEAAKTSATATPPPPAVSLATLHERAAALERRPDQATVQRIEAAIAQGWPSAAPELEGYLDANAELLAWLRAALAGSAPDPGEPLHAGVRIQDAGRLQRLLLLDGRRAQREKREAEALSAFVDALVFAHRHRDQAGLGLIGVTLGLNLQREAVGPTQELIHRSRIGERDWLAALERLARLSDGWRGLELAFAEELSAGEERVAAEARAAGTSDAPGAALVSAAYAARCAAARTALADAYAKDRPEEFRAWIAGLGRERASLSGRFLVEEDEDGALAAELEALTVLHVLLEALEPCFDLELARRAEFELLRAAMAVGVHQRRSGSAPSSLAELVPELLSSLPPDPYADGEPVRLARDGQHWWLYSIGPDRVDQGGRQSFDARDPDAGGDLLSFAAH